MKQGWEEKSLMEVASVSTGKWDANHATENGNYRFYTCAYDYLYCETKRFYGECLILPGNGVNVGEVFYYDGEFDAYQRTYVLSDIKILPTYLKYHMLLYWKALGTKQQYGSATNFIKIGNFKNYKVQYPPLSEQQRIVAILDQAFAAIAKAKANAEQNVQNAKALFESYLQGIFDPLTGSGHGIGEDWEHKKLGEIAFVKSGGTPSRSKKEYWEGNIAWYSSGELNDTYTTEPERHINELAIENSNAKSFPKGTLLIGMYDTAALKMSITDRDATFNQAIAGVKPNPKIDLLFILHAINAQKPELLNLRRGTRQKNLSLEKIKDISIPFPSIEVQQTIVRQLDALRAETQKLVAVYQQKIADLEELKKSILQKAFAGELKL